MASNDETLADEDGDGPDWIEIHMPDSAPAESLDLGGWYLTDNTFLQELWQFPDGVIMERGDFLVVFASGKDRAVAGEELHADLSYVRGAVRKSEGSSSVRGIYLLWGVAILIGFPLADFAPGVVPLYWTIVGPVGFLVSGYLLLFFVNTYAWTIIGVALGAALFLSAALAGRVTSDD